MVRNDGNGDVRTNQPSLHITERLDDREELLVVHLVVDLCRRELAREVSYGVEETIRVWLVEDAGDGEVGGVSAECRWEAGVEVTEERRGCECMLQRMERVSSIVREDEGSRRPILASESIEGGDDAGIPVDKTPVRVSETEKRLDILDGRRWGPVGDGVELVRVHLDALSAEQEAEVLHLGLVEGALLRIGEETSRAETIEHKLDVLIVFFL